MQIQLKETVTRWVIVEVPEATPDMHESELEELAQPLALAEVQEEGWDGEDVLESSYSISHEE